MAQLGNKESAFKRFMNENKMLAFMLPVLAVLVIILIIVYSGVFSSKPASASVQNTTSPSPSQIADNNQKQVEVLPQVVRTTTDSAIKPVNDPFSSPMKLKGVIYSSERSTAIVESGGVSYIVKENDTIGESTWSVVSIDLSSIVVESNGKSVVLSLTEQPSAPQGQ